MPFCFYCNGSNRCHVDRRAGPQGDGALLTPEERRLINDYETKMQSAVRVGRKARHQKTRFGCAIVPSEISQQGEGGWRLRMNAELLSSHDVGLKHLIRSMAIRRSLFGGVHT